MLKKIKTATREKIVDMLRKKIKKNVVKIPYNKNIIFNDRGLPNDCGVYKFISKEGNTGLVGVKHDPSLKALFRMLSFTAAGGKLIYLPMYAGIPTEENVEMYSIIGHATDTPADYLKKAKTINIVNGDFVPPGRFYPMPDIEKKYDFLIATWAGDIIHKHWDLVMEMIPTLCENHKLCLIVYKGRIKSDEREIINKFIKTENLILLERWTTKDEFPILLNESRILIVPSEWDNKPRVLDQALLCDVPVVVNKNIYGGHKFITEKTGCSALPHELGNASLALLQNSAGKIQTRAWYLENHGPYNAAIKLTKLVNETFNADFKLIYEDKRKFLFEKEYIKEIGMSQKLEDYLLSIV